MTRAPLQDRYELLRQLGHGGMAEVVLALDKRSGASVAVKRALPHLWTDAKIRARFEEEVRVMPLVSHPNIVRTLDVCDDNGAPALILEYIEGPSLVAIDRAARNLGRPLSPAAVAHIGGELLSALGYLHDVDLDDDERGVLHRDVTPSNILVTSTGAICLIDFGVAFASGREALTATGAHVGKIGYIAPEILGGESATAQSDLFSATVVLYELLCGASPFPGKTAADVVDAVVQGRIRAPSDVAPWMSPALAALLSRGLAGNASDRFEDAWEMAMALSDFLPMPDQKEVADIVQRFSPALAARALENPEGKTAVDDSRDPMPTVTKLAPATETDPVAMKGGSGREDSSWGEQTVTVTHQVTDAPTSSDKRDLKK